MTKKCVMPSLCTGRNFCQLEERESGSMSRIHENTLLILLIMTFMATRGGGFQMVRKKAVMLNEDGDIQMTGGFSYDDSSFCYKMGGIVHLF